MTSDRRTTRPDESDAAFELRQLAGEVAEILHRPITMNQVLVVLLDLADDIGHDLIAAKVDGQPLDFEVIARKRADHG